MIRKYLLALAVLVIPVLASFAVSPASAQALFEGATDQACQGANLGAGSNCSDNDKGAGKISQVIKNIINVLTLIIGIIAVILIIINGLKFITSNGDSNAITSARNGIIYAIVGLIVVALAQIIVRFVLGRIVT